VAEDTKDKQVSLPPRETREEQFSLSSETALGVAGHFNSWLGVILKELVTCSNGFMMFKTDFTISPWLLDFFNTAVANAIFHDAATLGPLLSEPPVNLYH